MTRATFKLDRRIFKLIQDGNLKRFTTCELRDAYSRQLAEEVSQTELRRYVYKEIGRLIRVGWLRKDENRQARGQQYHVLTMPEGITLRLVESGLSTLKFVELGPEDQMSNPQRLEALAREIRLDMLCSLGEAERYKQLFVDMPQLKSRVEDDYIEARDRSSRLLGHLKAVEKTLKLLTAV